MLLSLTALAGCGGNDMLDETGGLRISRSACPAVAIPAHTGDVTLFDPADSRDSTAIDVVATITNVRSTCTSSSNDITASGSFDVLASRRDAGQARTVVLPYFATVVRAGTRIVSKQLGQVTLNFPAGSTRAAANGTASTRVALNEASIPEDVERRINKRRKAGDNDAAVDPMSDPEVKSILSNANFELLVGFQLTEDQLKYNATR
jgi:hypothetical protein